MILIQIDRKKDTALFQQIVEQIKRLIDAETIRVGEKLPSTRRLAESLGVNRSTVYRAYEELWASGYLEATAGSYSTVRNRMPLVEKPASQKSTINDWNQFLSSTSNRLDEICSDNENTNLNLINFMQLSPDSNLLPINDFRKCMNFILINKGRSVLQYGTPLGYLPLRNYLAKQMNQHGISTNSDEIILTNGMQNGIEMVFNLITNPGDSVIIESPSYSSVLKMIKYKNLNPISIPMSAEGMDLEILEDRLNRGNPKLIYTMPTFHNPTGMSSSQAHREQLLALSEKYKVPIIEDGFEEEMKYFGKSILPIKSIDKNQMVIYLGTFSKVLFPGVRIGWIVAPIQLIKKLEAIKQISDLSGSPLTQAAISEFCKQGYYEVHKKRLHRAYRKRMQMALQACREFLPADIVQFTKPEGGYLIWLSLNRSVSESEGINEVLQAQGVALSPGSKFFANQPEHVHFRLSIAHRKEDEIREGIRRIGHVFKNL